MKKNLLCLILVFLFVSASAFGQQAGETRKRSGPRRQLATIIFAGLGGAIIGLSTLSFYGRPQDNLSNIAIGFAVGVIAGTIYVTARSATSRDYYDPGANDPNNPRGMLNLPDLRQLKEREVAFENSLKETNGQGFVFSPLLHRSPVNEKDMAVGGLVRLGF